MLQTAESFTGMPPGASDDQPTTDLRNGDALPGDAPPTKLASHGAQERTSGHQGLVPLLQQAVSHLAGALKSSLSSQEMEQALGRLSRPGQAGPPEVYLLNEEQIQTIIGVRYQVEHVVAQLVATVGMLKGGSSIQQEDAIRERVETLVRAEERHPVGDHLLTSTRQMLERAADSLEAHDERTSILLDLLQGVDPEELQS